MNVDTRRDRLSKGVLIEDATWDQVDKMIRERGLEREMAPPYHKALGRRALCSLCDPEHATTIATSTHPSTAVCCSYACEHKPASVLSIA